MKIRGKLSELRRQLVTGAIEEAPPQTALFFRLSLQFLLGFTLSAVPLQGRSGPLGIAAAAQSAGEPAGLCCAFGAMLGYLLFFPMQQSLQSICALLLICTLGYLLRSLQLPRRAQLMPLLTAVTVLLTELVSTGAAAGAASDALLAGIGCCFLREALDRRERMTEAAELRHGLSLASLCACVLMALCRLEIAGLLSVGRVLASLLVMALASYGGILPGTAAGILIGSGMDLTGAASGFYAAVYGLSALISSAWSRKSRYVFLLSFNLCSAAFALLYAGSGRYLGCLIENVTASVMFLLLPERILSFLASFLYSQAAAGGESGLRRYTARRMRQISEAFADLYTTVDQTMSLCPAQDTLPKLFDRVTEQVCGRCKYKLSCWNGSYMDTLTVFNDLGTLLQSKGILSREDLPGYFVQRCQNADALVNRVNAELRGQVYRRQYQEKLRENRSAAYQQYRDISEILACISEDMDHAYGPDYLAQRRLARYLNSIGMESDTSVFRDRSGRLHILLEGVRLGKLLSEPGYLDRLSEAMGVRLCRPGGEDCERGRLLLMEAEPLTVNVGIAARKKDGEAVSGDRGTYFKTEQGVLCILLSDGMGSGESAAKESVAAIRILERLLRSGVNPAQAMQLLNSVMLLKNTEEWGFATVDLLCVDLFTGDAAFYKYGAAPSYTRVGTQVRRVRSSSPAAGVSVGSGTAPDITRLRLRPGSIAVIASDGVIAESNDRWVKELLLQQQEEDMKQLAGKMLRTALKQYGCSDDMTVLAVRVENRS